MDKKFERVSLDNVLRADADGMPVFRNCFENEILMSFYDDEGAYEFSDWWRIEGSRFFQRYLEDNDSPIA